MKKTVVVLVLTLGMVFAAVSAYAAGTTTVGVSATISSVCKFDGTPSAVALTIDPTGVGAVTGTSTAKLLCTTGQTGIQFAVSGSGDGLTTFNVGATGGSGAAHMTSGVNTLNYTASFTALSGTTGLGFTSPTDDLSSSLTVSVAQADYSVAAAGTYNDTLTLTANY